MEAMNKKVLSDGSFLIVNKHVSKKDNDLSGTGSKISQISQNLTKTFNSNLFVKYIPAEVSEEEIRKVFGEVGEVKSIKLKKSTQIIDGEEVCFY
jgi:RNA recognition motif-containing protein